LLVVVAVAPKRNRPAMDRDLSEEDRERVRRVLPAIGVREGKRIVRAHRDLGDEYAALRVERRGQLQEEKSQALTLSARQSLRQHRTQLQEDRRRGGELRARSLRLPIRSILRLSRSLMRTQQPVGDSASYRAEREERRGRQPRNEREREQQHRDDRE